ncbi:diguanylate cyclase [Kineothrix sp. MSJ-39]|uniref:diguanylate cyclase n=1 Tax=Kineothrix sp. MSJ-39 TaxID=2841533 RepID=UPI001C10B1F0|nr:diguanylate cyclase [Kineothrix sp. MSJ-39]MBU5428831.1 diguanylate cyclase [Kineothrix sp. MSJ-39]
MENTKKTSLKHTLLKFSLVPVLVLGLVLTLISTRTLIRETTDEVSQSLKIAARSVYNTYSLVAPGDMYEKDGIIYKGEVTLTGDYSIVDSLKESYGMDITLFYGDKRVLTTLTDQKGKRLSGTSADEEVSHWVLENGKDYFSGKISIGGTTYFGYYVPIYNKDGSVVGMAFASKTRASVMTSVRTNVLNSMAVSLLVTIAALLCCIVASQKLVDALKAIMDYLGHLANSDFSTKMPVSVLRRKDEIGAMGSYAATVSCSLKDMITTDPLTGLLNRRACRSSLQKMIEQCRENRQRSLSVTIGDIDFFKRINDTYGHECGDMVLRSVSNIFKKNMEEKGLVSRWGGEEFLLAFELPLAQAHEKLEQIAAEIRETTFAYEGETFSVSLTFGLTGVTGEQPLDEIVKDADDLLYRGKAEGRNRIVTSETGKA